MISYIPNPFDASIYQWDGQNAITTGYTIIKRSKDGLVDTLLLESGASRIDVKHYDENQRLVCVEWNYPVCKVRGCLYEPSEYMYSKEVFEYDTENRISKKTTFDVGSVTGKESIVSVDIFDYSALILTEKGYIYEDSEFELDEKGRVVYLKNLNPSAGIHQPDEYMELNGKKYRIDDTYYTYFEGGFSSFYYSKTSFWILGAKDRWVKTDRIYSENGILRNVYQSFDGEEWEVYEKNEFLYVYNDTIIMSNKPKENITPSETVVYGIPGAIIINTNNNGEVSIYNITGGIVKKQKVIAGTTQIDVPLKGLYFLTLNNCSFKVLVR